MMVASSKWRWQILDGDLLGVEEAVFFGEYFHQLQQCCLFIEKCGVAPSKVQIQDRSPPNNILTIEAEQVVHHGNNKSYRPQ